MQGSANTNLAISNIYKWRKLKQEEVLPKTDLKCYVSTQIKFIWQTISFEFSKKNRWYTFG